MLDTSHTFLFPQSFIFLTGWVKSSQGKSVGKLLNLNSDCIRKFFTLYWLKRKNIDRSQLLWIFGWSLRPWIFSGWNVEVWLNPSKLQPDPQKIPRYHSITAWSRSSGKDFVPGLRLQRVEASGCEVTKFWRSWGPRMTFRSCEVAKWLKKVGVGGLGLLRFFF